MIHAKADGRGGAGGPARRPAPRSYYNRYPERLPEEQAAADSAGVVPAEVPGDESDALAVEGERMIYVVAGDHVLVAPRYSMGQQISHAVLADGGPVQAAGEIDAVTISGKTVVISLDNKSGHYRPGRISLAVAKAAFESRGVQVAPDSLVVHPGSGS